MYIDYHYLAKISEHLTCYELIEEIYIYKCINSNKKLHLKKKMNAKYKCNEQ